MFDFNPGRYYIPSQTKAESQQEEAYTLACYLVLAMRDPERCFCKPQGFGKVEGAPVAGEETPVSYHSNRSSSLWMQQERVTAKGARTDGES